MHVIAAKAVAFREAMQPKFVEYQEHVVENAKAMVEIFNDRNYQVVSGGTDNHLLLLDLTKKGLTGKQAEYALGRANITVNKNTVPNDTKSPFVTSGVRLGTPAMTTRGFKQTEATLIANWICDILDDCESEEKIEKIKQKVLELCSDFPVYR